MSKGSTTRPRAAHVTKEQYDANYEAIFGTGSEASKRCDRSDHGPDSSESEEPGGQPDPQAKETVEAERRCPVCQKSAFLYQPGPGTRWTCGYCKFSHEGGPG